jgi:ComF family protein
MALPAIVGRRPVYRLYHLAWAGLDWLYPPLCGGCGKSGSRWCEECQNATKTVPESVCQYCGQIISVPGVCAACQVFPPYYSKMRAWGVFEGRVRNAVHRLKYERDLALGEVFARYLMALLHDLAWRVDLVAPVPIGKARLAERGYNQTALLALPLALGSGLKYRPRAIVKSRNTRSQVGLTSAERRENVSDAFKADPAIVKDRNVLVIDDVATSGATMNACAKALKQAGAKVVYGLVLARATREMHDHSVSK